MAHCPPMKPKPDLMDAWLRLREAEGEEGQPKAGQEEAHEAAFSDFTDAVYGLLEENRLHDVVTFSSDHLAQHERIDLLVDAMSLAGRLDLAAGEGKISSTRLFVMPLTGPARHLGGFHRAEGFERLLRGCGLFPEGSEIAMIGALSLETAAAMRLDLVAQIVSSFDTLMGEDDLTPMSSLAPILARLCLEDRADTQDSTIGHAVVMGICRQVAPSAEMAGTDLLEAPTPESDLAWVEAFTAWCESIPEQRELPWMTSPPAKWETGLADGLVQATLMDLAMMADGTGGAEMPRAVYYKVSHSGADIVIEGTLASGLPMGQVRFGAPVGWLLPQAIAEWRSWDCQVDYFPPAPLLVRPTRLN